ncbi:MAG: response regulator [Deltaproteobacteria bacterium]|nr:response regulator [Deltaproteobacteria bacterium]
MKPTRVLIVDDEKETVKYLATVLRENGFTEIDEAFNGEEALDKVRETRPGLILLDLKMPKKNGIVVFNEIKKSPDLKEIPVVILTSAGDFLRHLAELRNFQENAEALGDEPTDVVLDRFLSARPEGFIEKPIEPEALISLANKILITLEEVKSDRFKEINDLRKEKIDAGIVFKGATFDTSEQTRNYLTALAAMLTQGNEDLPNNFTLRSVDNKDIPMTKDDVLALHAAITKWVYDNFKASWQHKENINSLSTIEEVQAYDIRAGWPPNTI